MIENACHYHPMSSIYRIVLAACTVGTSVATRAADRPEEDWFRNPFGKDSAHHRPIGNGAIYAGEDEGCTREWLQHPRLAINNEYPWGAAFAAVEAVNPLTSVTFASCYGSTRKADFPVMIRIPTDKFPVNDPPTGRCIDGNTSIFDRATWRVHELYEYRWNDGHPTASVHKEFDIRGPGHGDKLGDRSHGVTAVGVATTFGALQPWELLLPGHRIGHAFQVVLPRKPGQPRPLLISKSIQWPATAGDGSACRPDQNTGHIPYGGLLAIPPVEKGGPDLRSLGLSEAGLRLGEAFRDYGIYVVDGGGNSVLRTTENLPAELNAQLKNSDLPKLHRFLRLVKNSVSGATAHILTGDTYKAEGDIGTPTWPAGGGTPLAPNTAIDAVPKAMPK